MNTTLSNKQVRHANRRARQKAKKQNFNEELKMEMNNADIKVTATVTPAQTEGADQIQNGINTIDEMASKLPEDVQAALKDGSLDYDALSDIDKVRVREILEVSCKLTCEALFDGKVDQKIMPALINELTNISVTMTRKSLSVAEKKTAVTTSMDIIVAMLPPLSENKIQFLLDSVTKDMGFKIDVKDLKSMQSSAVSSADVRAEENWITGSNMFIGGAVIGTIFNMVTQGITITNGLVGIATAGAGYFAKDTINEMVEDSTVKLVGAGVVGAGITIGGTMALDAIRAKLRDGSGVTQEA